MKRIPLASSAAALMALSGCLLFTQPVRADVEAECREEAADYNISAEQLPEYIENCIASRGGIEVSQNLEEDGMPPYKEEMLDDKGEGE